VLNYVRKSEVTMILDNVKERMNAFKEDYSFLKECL